MVYIDPAAFRNTRLRKVSQQETDGALPGGIRLNGSAELKYINQITHTDDNVWLPITLSAYLDETEDHTILNEPVTSDDQTRTVGPTSSGVQHGNSSTQSVSTCGMREDIGRLTQKHPGHAENGSIYNHTAIFYVLALYRKALIFLQWPCCSC